MLVLFCHLYNLGDKTLSRRCTQIKDDERRWTLVYYGFEFSVEVVVRHDDMNRLENKFSISIQPLNFICVHLRQKVLTLLCTLSPDF